MFDRMRIIAGIKTEQFDFVFPISQTCMVDGTRHAKGVCSGSSSLFLRSLLTGGSIEMFKSPHYPELLPRILAEEQNVISHFKSGMDPDAHAFDKTNQQSAVAVTSVTDVSALLDKKTEAANVTYNTSSGYRHSIVFFRDGGRCVMQDVNRFTGIRKPDEKGACTEVTDTIQQIIARSQPGAVKVTYVPRKSRV